MYLSRYQTVGVIKSHEQQVNMRVLMLLLLLDQCACAAVSRYMVCMVGQIYKF